MPYYNKLKYSIRPVAARDLVVDKLMSLRRRLDDEIPAKDADEHLLLATWNIRDFDKANRRGYGRRLPETHFYIAEIISRFDFVAVQEVNRLGEWETVMDILGSSWDYIATDVTDTSLGGNGERLTYVFDKRKVWFQNIAGEIVLPAHMLISKVETQIGEDKFVAGKQFRRSPFVASFQAGWFKFDICTVHIYYGANYGDKLDQRIEEIGTIAEYLSKRADINLNRDRALILLGDFNIVCPEHETMEALLEHGFRVPSALQLETNVSGGKYYDQIAFKTKKGVLQFADREENAGVFKLFESCFTTTQLEDYREAMTKTTALFGDDYNGDVDKYYHDWRTYQLSDHSPLWVRLRINESEDYLQGLKS